MKKIVNGVIVALNDEEQKKMSEAFLRNHDKNYHFLAFDGQFQGFNPLASFVSKNQKLLDDEVRITQSIIERKEVCSLYPEEKLTIFPFRLKDDNSGNYEIDLENIDKHFSDILELNDVVYKTKYLYVDFGHIVPSSLYDLLIGKIRGLLKDSKILECVYIEQL